MSSSSNVALYICSMLAHPRPSHIVQKPDGRSVLQVAHWQSQFSVVAHLDQMWDVQSHWTSAPCSRTPTPAISSQAAPWRQCFQVVAPSVSVLRCGWLLSDVRRSRRLRVFVISLPVAEQSRSDCSAEEAGLSGYFLAVNTLSFFHQQATAVNRLSCIHVTSAL